MTPVVAASDVVGRRHDNCSESIVSCQCHQGYRSEQSMSDTREKVKEAIDSAAEKAKEETDEAARKSSEAAQKVGDKVQDAGRKIKDLGE